MLPGRCERAAGDVPLVLVPPSESEWVLPIPDPARGMSSLGEEDASLPAPFTVTLDCNSSGPWSRATGFASSLSPIPAA